MKKVIYLILFLPFLFSSCETSSFIQTNDVGWSTILLADNMTFEKSWNEVIDIVAKKYEMDVISKDGGYARSRWYGAIKGNGQNSEQYRNRVTIKFSADRTKIDIKTEAQYRTGKDKWINGYDSKVLQNLKEDISGVVGRTVK